MSTAKIPILSKFILVSCFFMHLQIPCSQWIYSVTQGQVPLGFNLMQGLLYLLYPVCGWIADKYMYRFKLFKSSFVFMTLISFFICFSYVLVGFVSPNILQETHKTIFIGFLMVAMTALSLSMYDANTIQLGMDQMIEASSDQLRSFIYWYQWCAHIGPLLVYYSEVYSTSIHSTEKIHEFIFKHLQILFVVFSLITFSSCILHVIFIFCCKRLYHVEQSSRNPLKIVYQVLKYAYYHKYPERRSAFTYWENDLPSRIDLGKDKYGGPFTYEQVEDVKTMLRLLLLMVCLFGFHISGDGYSLSNYIMNTMGCPSKGSLFFLILNPTHIPLIIVSLAIPIQQLLRKRFPFHFPKTLTLLKVGLLLCLVTESLMCFISALIALAVRYSSVCEVISPRLWEPPLSLKCIACIAFNSTYTCSDSCYSSPHLQYIVYLTIIPFTLKGLSYVFVFVTMFEFICAQSPNSMKGLLIGVWYSTLAIKYCVMNVLDHYFQYLELEAWNLYHGIKGLTIFISIISFYVSCSKYRYRERNEVVNEQRMIEDQYERELLLNTSENISDLNVLRT